MIPVRLDRPQTTHCCPTLHNALHLAFHCTHAHSTPSSRAVSSLSLSQDVQRSMGHIARLEIKDFKSYGGSHVIGPFHRFTAVVGPNGSGKSNLMDAISFVLGVHSRQLRSTQLRDLIHRAPGDTATDTERSAFVTLVYALAADETLPAKSLSTQHLSPSETQNLSLSPRELTFTRLLSDKGVGSYRLNGHDVSSETYQSQLKDIGILVKARNFLVFQGDVESIASKRPAELTKLFEQISLSDELKTEYDQLLEAKNAAEEDTIFACKRKKGLVAEKRLVRACVTVVLCLLTIVLLL